MVQVVSSLVFRLYRENNVAQWRVQGIDYANGPLSMRIIGIARMNSRFRPDGESVDRGSCIPLSFEIRRASDTEGEAGTISATQLHSFKLLAFRRPSPTYFPKG